MRLRDLRRYHVIDEAKLCFDYYFIDLREKNKHLFGTKNLFGNKNSRLCK